MACDCLFSSVIYALGWFSFLSFVGPLIHKLFFKKKVNLVEPNWKKDVVYLVEFPGNATISSFSPYCIKVEAFLRLHKIAFERRNVLTERGSNSKLPFVELNGEQISDSEIILQRLSEKYGIKDEYGSPQEEAQAHALGTMADYHSAFLLTHFKLKRMEPMVEAFFDGKVSDAIKTFLLPVATWILTRMIGKKVKAAGKFTESQYTELVTKDLQAILSTLGDKPFLFGDHPTKADCTVFGQLAALYYISPGSRAYLPCNLIDSEEFAPLKAWIERVRETIFADEFHT